MLYFEIQQEIAMKKNRYFLMKTFFRTIFIITLIIQTSACVNESDVQSFDPKQGGAGTPSTAGACGVTSNTCLAGVFNDAPDTATENLWTCRGQDGGIDASCKLPKPMNGACGTTKNTCVTGVLRDTPDTDTNYLWSCQGTGGGTNASCTAAQPPLASNCVQVFYDRTGENGNLARSYALMVLNLMGHFPEHQQIIGPIELYKKGDLNRCAASFYIGMTMDNPLPADFLTDYKNTTQQVVWMGYNFWQLGPEFEKTFGYKTYELNNLDSDHKTPAPDSKPSFFRDVLYKGEVFAKYNVWLKGPPKVLDGAFEMTKLTNKSSSAATVLAEVRHSFTGELIPWALQNANKFYISEVPLSYFHEADRYFVFADLMFDFLKEQPKHNAKHAFIRLEDIGPMEDLGNLQEAMDILTRNGVPAHMNLYPIFNDPLYAVPGHAGKPMTRMEDAPQFSAAIQKHIAAGTTVIWHGVTHQYSNIKNPYTGASGDDYEFWNSVTNSPLAEDSVSYVLNKMDDGFKSLKSQNIEPTLWVIPHYEASALDNVMFGQMFPWMISRGVYIDNKIEGLQPQDPNKSIFFSIANTEETNKNRRDFFASLKVTTNPSIRFGQIFPYELYGDLYAQHVIPENLGNVEPSLTIQVQFVRTVDTILEDAKRNLVLRDVWASVFYHPFLLDPKYNKANGDKTKPKDLERLVSGIKAMGYNFINLNTWVSTHKDPVGKPRIELEETRK